MTLLNLKKPPVAESVDGVSSSHRSPMVSSNNILRNREADKKFSLNIDGNKVISCGGEAVGKSQIGKIGQWPERNPVTALLRVTEYCDCGCL